MKKHILIVIILILFSIRSLYAETSMFFLNVPPDAKGLALGRSMVSLANDANANYWNPAVLSLIDSIQISYTHSFWIADLQYAGFGINFPVSKVSTIGIDFRGMGFGKIRKTKIGIGETSDEISAGSFNIAVACAFKLIPKKLAIGIKFGFCSEMFEQERNANYGINGGLSLYWKIYKNLKFGIVSRNIGISVYRQIELLSMEIQSGLSYKFELKKVFKFIDISGDYFYSKSNPDIHAFCFGSEIAVGGLPSHFDIYLLFGWTIPSFSYDNFSIPSFGMGMEWKKLRIDWGCKYFGDFLGWAHSISVNYKIKTGMRSRKKSK